MIVLSKTIVPDINKFWKSLVSFSKNCFLSGYPLIFWKQCWIVQTGIDPWSNAWSMFCTISINFCQSLNTLRNVMWFINLNIFVFVQIICSMCIELRLIENMRVGWNIHDIISFADDFFGPVGSKPYNSDRSVGNTRGTMLKNKLHLVTFHESILVSLWTFQPTLL